MARYVVTAEIARPPRVVFDFLDTPENTPRFTEGLISCHQLSGVRKGVGTRVLRMTVAGGRAPVDATQNVTEDVEGALSRGNGTVYWYATYDAVTRVEPAAGTPAATSPR